jgi:hypothetical protein
MFTNNSRCSDVQLRTTTELLALDHVCRDVNHSNEKQALEGQHKKALAAAQQQAAAAATAHDIAMTSAQQLATEAAEAHETALAAAQQAAAAVQLQLEQERVDKTQEFRYAHVKLVV